MNTTRTWKPDGACFAQPSGKSKGLQGITKVLKQLFYPNYSFKNATEGVALGNSRGEVKAKVLAERKANGGRGAGKVSAKKLVQAGMKMGNELDDELLLLTRKLVERGDSVSMVEVLTDLIQDRTKEVKFSSDTVKIWAALDKLSLRPVASQVPVWSEKMNITTKLDLLCLNTENHNLVNVQIKRGYNGYYEKHTKTPMSPPFSMLNDSPFYQHQLQILYEWLMMQHSFTGPKHVVMTAMVLRVDNDGVSSYPLTERMLTALGQLAVLAMTNRKAILKERRTTKKKLTQVAKVLEAAFPESRPAPKVKVPVNGKSVHIKKKTPKKKKQEAASSSSKNGH